MNFKQKLFSIIVSFCMVIGILTTVNVNCAQAAVNDYQNTSLKLQVKSAIAVDANTGQVLYADNAEKPLPIASMTKLVTVYLTLQAIKNGQLKWDQKVVPDAQAVKVSQNTNYSNVPLRKGHSYTIRQLYQATLIESANGAAMTLAKAVAGKQVNFVNQMRALLKKWGINDAKIYTTDGLPNGTSGNQAYPGVKKSAENEMSANDMAIVARNIIRDYPAILNTTKILNMKFTDGSKVTEMKNWNWMLPGGTQASKYKVDGLKTGTTDAAGACFVSTETMNNQRLITVVMGAKHTDGSDPSRFVQTEKLLNHINQNYKVYALEKGTTFTGTKAVQIPNGKVTSTKLVMKNNSAIWLADGSTLSANFTQKTLSAPLTAGQTVGQYQLLINKKNIPTLSTNNVTVSATTTQNINKANIFVRIWRWFKNLF